MIASSLAFLEAAASLDWTVIAMWTGVSVVLLVPGATCVWMARRLGRIRYVPIERLEQVDHRITKLSAALSLLTDTTEAAFRDVVQEIARQTRATHNESPFERRLIVRRILPRGLRYQRVGRGRSE
jgi:hypothetical protein